jgi:hypothetical protein
MRHRSPQAVVEEWIDEVAQADFRPELGCQPGQSVSPFARANPAGDPDDHEGIEGEALTVVHRPMFLFRSLPVKPPNAVCKLATKAPSGAQWADEIKLDGCRLTTAAHAS